MKGAQGLVLEGHVTELPCEVREKLPEWPAGGTYLPGISRKGGMNSTHQQGQTQLCTPRLCCLLRPLSLSPTSCSPSSFAFRHKRPPAACHLLAVILMHLK